MAGTVHGPKTVNPRTIAMIAPREAPEVTPTIPGSASALPNSPWSAAPAMANDAPTIAAWATRGSRSSHTTCAAEGSTPPSEPLVTCANRIRRTSSGGNDSGPVPTPKTTAARRMTVNTVATSAPGGRRTVPAAADPVGFAARDVRSAPVGAAVVIGALTDQGRAGSGERP